MRTFVSMGGHVTQNRNIDHPINTRNGGTYDVVKVDRFCTPMRVMMTLCPFTGSVFFKKKVVQGCIHRTQYYSSAFELLQ